MSKLNNTLLSIILAAVAIMVWAAIIIGACDLMVRLL